MTQFFKELGSFLIVLFVLVQLLSFGSLWALRQGSIYKPSFLINSVEESDFDYIVLGASTGLTTLNTHVIDSTLGITGLNLSMDDTAMSSHYLMLQHFLASGKTTKICVIAPSLASYNTGSKKLSDNDYRFLPFVSKPYVRHYYKAFDGFEARIMRQSTWLPLAGVGYYNMELFYPSIISLFNSKKHNRFDEKGNYTYPIKYRNSEIIENRTPVNMELNNEYLKLIYNLCRSNDIKLVCYISPLEKIKVNPLQSKYQIINHSDFLKNKHFFYDAIHINSNGRQLVSERFANELAIYLK